MFIDEAYSIVKVSVCVGSCVCQRVELCVSGLLYLAVGVLCCVVRTNGRYRLVPGPIIEHALLASCSPVCVDSLQDQHQKDSYGKEAIETIMKHLDPPSCVRSFCWVCHLRLFGVLAWDACNVWHKRVCLPSIELYCAL